MENPDVVLLKDQIAMLQNAVYQLTSMLHSNFPNGGFGGSNNTVFGYLDMGTLMREGKGPKAYLRWLSDQSFVPKPIIDYPGVNDSWNRDIVNYIVKAIRDHLGDDLSASPSCDRAKRFDSKYFATYTNELEDGFYHTKSGSTDYLDRNDQGVLLTCGAGGDFNTAKVYFPFSNEGGRYPQILVYVPIEDKWVKGGWEHVDLDNLKKVVDDFLDGSTKTRDAYRPPKIPDTAVVELFEGLDLVKYFGEPKTVSSLTHEREVRAGVEWQYLKLISFPHYEDPSQPQKHYLRYRNGNWVVSIYLFTRTEGEGLVNPHLITPEMVGANSVEITRLPTWSGDRTTRTLWSDMNTTRQWSFYRQILKDLNDKMLNVERAA